MSPAKLLWIHAILFLLLAAPALADQHEGAPAEVPIEDAAAALDEGLAEGEAAIDDGMAAAEAAADEVAETAEAMADAVPSETPELEEWANDPAPAAMAPAVDPENPPALGAVGWDSEGRQGRIHIVVGGDTLWDISNAYLGTPWVWPSIWNDNG
ncbi:MAG: LysM domain-containing protein, partial [Myxococcota bacterium]|nr:LysM domain-containing protein [Myxococcota bacterium]